MQVIKFINFVVSATFFVCYFYQLIYVLVPFFIKKRMSGLDVRRKYAVLISARNEQAVIKNLIDSIKKQNYYSDCIDIFVVADNCTDKTAKVAKDAGAIVWERKSKKLVGKGYALDFLYNKINSAYPDNDYSGFFIFDADNILDKNYIAEMNKTFSEGYRVVTCYRNSKNYSCNWISAGYALWFLRESKYINEARMLLGTSCSISGTGFLVSSEILREIGGWKFFLLTEDIQFTVHNIIRGERIGYSRNAVVYDEQPVKFSQSWKQRMRWAKGFYQVFLKYGKDLCKGVVKSKSFACFDMLMIIIPAILMHSMTLIMNILAVILAESKGFDSRELIKLMLYSLISMYFIMYSLGLITTITEWKNINCSNFKKLLYTFTFPIFLSTYIPISVIALFKNVKWEPIKHSYSLSIEEIQTDNNIKLKKAL